MKPSWYVLTICTYVTCFFPIFSFGQSGHVNWSTFSMGFSESNGGATLVRSAVGQTFSGYSSGTTGGVQSGFLTDTMLVLPAKRNSLMDLQVTQGWNMVSLPVIPHDARKVSLFPTAQSAAFSYELVYVPKDTLWSGIGYWLKFTPEQVVNVEGILMDYNSVHVRVGWNMIGSISMPVYVSAVRSDSGGVILSQFFGYNGAYVIVDSILPGKGYWVKANKSCNLFLSSSGGNTTRIKNKVTVVPTAERPPMPPFGSEGITNQKGLPKEYALEEAYPNPFNPSSTIRYQLPIKGRVSLKVYNLLGQVVTVLGDGMEEAGFKSVVWNASGFASGVYFYRLEATSLADPARTFTSVKKMVLVK